MTELRILTQKSDLRYQAQISTQISELRWDIWDLSFESKFWVPHGSSKIEIFPKNISKRFPWYTRYTRYTDIRLRSQLRSQNSDEILKKFSKKNLNPKKYFKRFSLVHKVHKVQTVLSPQKFFQKKFKSKKIFHKVFFGTQGTQGTHGTNPKFWVPQKFFKKKI